MTDNTRHTAHTQAEDYSLSTTLTALCKAVVPTSEALLGSAPHVSNEVTSSELPDNAAMCNGHLDRWSLA